MLPDSQSHNSTIQKKPYPRIGERLPKGYRPDVSIPPDYAPGHSLPKGYMPHAHDLQTTHEMLLRSRQNKLSRNQVIALAIGAMAIIAVVTVIGMAIASALLLQGGTATPESTIQTFYDELRARDYSHAYQMLSTQADKQITSSAFADRYTQLDVIRGPIASFTIHSSTVQGATATEIVNVTRNNAGGIQEVDTVTLQLNNATWYIEAIATQNNAPPPK